MQSITIDTWIDAPIERCFDAARDLDLHVASIPGTNERAIGGKLTGLIGADEEVTWRARHFFVTQELTSRITRFDPPHHFRDEMQRGAFKSFVHDHFFVRENGRTKMTDHLLFAAPLGILGRIAEVVVLRRYLNRMLTHRAHVIARAAESKEST